MLAFCFHYGFPQRPNFLPNQGLEQSISQVRWCFLLASHQERTIKLRAMWSHRKQWSCWKSTWRKLVDRYKLHVCLFEETSIWIDNLNMIMYIQLSPFHFRIPLDSYSFSSGAQRHPSHWTCQSYQLQFWLCKGNRSFCPLSPSHQLFNLLWRSCFLYKWSLPVGKQRNLFLEVWWHKSRERRGKILHCHQGDGGVAWWVWVCWFISLGSYKRLN